MRFIVITGLSGAGKTEAMRAFEDIGYFCVDNLPAALIPKFAELCLQSDGSVEKVAVVSDIRGGTFFEALSDALQSLEDMGIPYEIVYLEAANEVLVRRFKESRRRHPLGAGGGLVDGIANERERLAGLRGFAHHLVDTSNFTLADLRSWIHRYFGETEEPRLDVQIVSFGYKRGTPLDVDLLFDVRFLPNPHYVDSLRPDDGRSKEVADYVFRGNAAQRLVQHLTGLFEFLLPQYVREGKRLLVIGIGCTGGRHRSVAISERLAQVISGLGYQTQINHRDLAEAPMAQPQRLPSSHS